jgi:AcrR family transcriptional regulator
LPPRQPASSSQAPKGKRHEARRQEIVEAAERVFGRAGYSSATTADIAAEVGITQPALYRYFSSKRDLFLEALAFRQAEIQAGVEAALAGPGSIREKLGRIGAATERLVLAHPEMAMLRIQAIALASHDAEVRDRIIETIDRLFSGHKALLAAGAAEGSLREDIDTHAVAASITGMALFFYVATTIDHPLAKLEDGEPMVARLLNQLTGEESDSVPEAD